MSNLHLIGNGIKMKANKLAQGFPIQMVLMVILGIVLLGLGLGLFGKIFSQGEDFTGDLSNSLKSNIDSNYCQGEKALCAPTYVLRGKDSDIKYINVVNLDSTQKDYRININYPTTLGELESSCGVLNIQEYGLEFTIESGKTSQIPIAFSKKNVNSRPCSFTTTMELVEVGVGVVANSKIPLIIRIE